MTEASAAKMVGQMVEHLDLTKALDLAYMKVGWSEYSSAELKDQLWVDLMVSAVEMTALMMAKPTVGQKAVKKALS